MVGRLLLRGLLAGLVAGLLCFAFLKAFGEPQVDRAIAFETRMDEARAKAAAAEAEARGLPAPPDAAEAEIVGRPTQAGIGLFTGVMVYSTAFGGLFALAFALAYGRMAELGPRETAALLAGVGFVAVTLVPTLKYPANPPSVGDPDTIGLRTGLYFAAIAVSLAAAVACGMMRRRLAPSRGPWNAALWAGAAYLATMIAAAALLPAMDEVPAEFPAATLWAFRVTSLGAQAILWATLGLVFGALSERVAGRRGAARHDAAVVRPAS